MAVSRDGTILLVSDSRAGSHAIHVFRVADGALQGYVGAPGAAPLHFNEPQQAWVASDDFVFVVDHENGRVQVLTPAFDFHGFVGVGQLESPAGVCANDDVVVVSEFYRNRITVFNRGDSTLLRRFGSRGSGNGQLDKPRGLCFTSADRHVAVADAKNDRVSVFSIDGSFIRHVGVGVLQFPTGVACSAFDELVVADRGNRRVALFSASGEVLKTIGRGSFGGVAIHGSTIYAQDDTKQECIVFQ